LTLRNPPLLIGFIIGFREMFQRSTHGRVTSSHTYYISYDAQSVSAYKIYSVAISRQWPGLYVRSHDLAIVLRTHLNLSPRVRVRIRLRVNDLRSTRALIPDPRIYVLTKNTEFQTRLYNIIVALNRFHSSFLVRSCVMVSGVE